MNLIQKLVYEIDSDEFDYLQIHTGLNQFCLKYNLSEKTDCAYAFIKEMLFEHLRNVRPLTLRITYAELSGEAALDFMVEGATSSPLPAGAADSLSPRVKALVEEPTVRGFRVKLVI